MNFAASGTPTDEQVRATLACRLREEQDRAGLTVERLAALSGVGVRMLAYYRAGEMLPRWTTLMRLAAALGVEPVDLLCEHGARS